MTCSSCSAHVEKAVNKVNGIEKVTVNLLSNNMVVEYDEAVSTNNDIIRAVENAGYEASVAEYTEKQEGMAEKKPNSINRKDFEISKMRNRVIISFIFLLPLMYMAMHNMLFEFFGLPVPKMFVDFFDGGENAFKFVLAQLLLLMPIVYVNRSYFSNGFKRLVKGIPTMDSLIAIGSGASIIYGIYTLYKIGNF